MVKFLFNPYLLFLGLIGNGVAAYFYNFWFLNSMIALTITAAIAWQFVQLGWEDSDPNQWLLIIENGKMVRAGVGLRCFRWWYQTAVRFSSSIKKVSFSAMQVTREMQGVEIKGIAIWGVDRTVQNEGPFKYYKNMTTGDSDTNVRTMCESIVRHIISNTDLDKVLKDRDHVREAMKKELQQQLSGWGVWLETVEITDVRICSRTLFEDMQARFKQDEFLKAEMIRQDTSNKIEENKMRSDLTLAQQRDRQDTERTKRDNAEKLKRQRQDYEFFRQNLQNQIERIEQEKIMEIEKSKNSHEIDKKKLEQYLELERQKYLNELDQQRKELELENSMSETNFQKYQIDSMKLTLQNLPLQNFRINNFVPHQDAGLLSFLPGLSDFYKQFDAKTGTKAEVSAV